MQGGYADQFAGGGFMPTQGPAQGQAQQRQPRGNREETLRAVVIRQLVQAAAAAGPDADLVLDGADVSNVTLVGKVLSAAERGGGIDLKITDGTGTTDVQWAAWAEADASAEAIAQRLASWSPGTYVRVYGNVKPFNGSRSVTAFAIRPIHDFNELTYHYLQAVFQHVHLLHGGGTGGGGAAGEPQQQGGYAGGSGYGGPAAGGWQQQQPPRTGGYGGGVAQAPAGPGGMDPCASAVYQIISDPAAGEKGVHISDVSTRLAPRGFTMQQVQAALSFLQNEAHAYTTCDDHHWRAT